MLQIVHDLKIGFNRYEMFTDRFEKLKKVVQDNNFKMIHGSNKLRADFNTKQQSVNRLMKSKRMIYFLTQLRETGEMLDNMTWGKHFVDAQLIDKYVEGLRTQIRKEKEKFSGKVTQKAKSRSSQPKGEPI